MSVSPSVRHAEVLYLNECTAVTKFQGNPSASALNARGVYVKTANFDRNGR